MATVTGLTAARMLEIEAASIVDGNIVGDDLILVREDGGTIDAGNVRGPAGENGDPGPPGEDGVGTGPAGGVLSGTYPDPEFAVPMSIESVRLASGVGFVNHGAVASTARPTGYKSVRWLGSVEPTNATNDDFWSNTVGV